LFAVANSLLLISPVLAQDTRTATEPHIPAVCATLTAALSAKAGVLAEADEQKLDTVRLQEAIDSCAPGKAIELRGEAGKNAFLSGPLELRHAVTLLIDSGVTLLASRDPRLFDVYPGVCGTVTAQQRRGCKPLIHVADTAAAVMGDGARSREPEAGSAGHPLQLLRRQAGIRRQHDDAASCGWSLVGQRLA